MALTFCSFESLCKEVEIKPRRCIGDMLEDITNQLSINNRPLFIDEANYLMRFPELRDTIMDIHDLSTMPVILVGMLGIERDIRASAKLENRFLIDVQFQPLDMDDARMLTDMMCEVSVSDDLLADLHKFAKGNTRRIATGLYRIEQIASQVQARRMDLKTFKQSEGTYFLGVMA